MDTKFKWPLTVLIIASILLGVMVIRGVETFDDTTIYLSAMQQIQDKTPVYPEKNYINNVIPLLNNPATIVLSAWIGKIFSSELMGLALLNWVFYVLSVFLFYNTALLIFKNKNRATIATVFLSANYSMLRFGPGAYLTDMGGWFFYIVSLYLAVRFFYSQNDKYAYLSATASMAGLFFKEYGGIGILSLGIWILLSERSLKSKIILIIKCGLFLSVNVGYHIWAYVSHGYLYWNRYQTVVRDFAPLQTVFRTIKVMGYLFNLGWPLAFWGFLKGISTKFTGPPERKKIFLGFLPSAIIFLAYPSYDQRIAFVAVPLLSLLAALGINTNSKKVIYITLGLYIACNFFLIHKLSLPDTSL